ncbi:hypothetical protein V1511DRAFT_320732 [Dipodascopsis uninucleata]
MSIRGMKKAVVRAPHVLIGSKSPEDLSIIEWTKAINEAETGVEEILKESKKFREGWRSILTVQSQISTDFESLYQPIPEEDDTKVMQETPKSTMDAIDKYRDVLIEIKKAIDPILDSIDVSIIQKCNTVQGHIDSIKKALKKREHKKIDYDRYMNSVEKMHRKEIQSDKAELNLEKAKLELDKFTQEFQLHDERIRTILPQFLVHFSEFIEPLATVFYNIQINIYQIYLDFMYPYAQQQGLATAIQSIDKDWLAQFGPIKHKCETSLKILVNGKAVQQPMTLPDSTPIDEKLKRVFTLKKKGVRRPAGTTKNGVYRSFTDINSSRTSTMVSSEESAGSAADFSDFNTISSPALESTEYPIALNPKLINRPLSRASTATTLYSPRYRSFSDASALATSDKKAITEETESSTEVPTESSSEGDTNVDYEIMTAIYTFVATEPTDLGFNVGDQIKVFKKNEDQWWEGETLDGRRGEFPGNYVIKS